MKKILTLMLATLVIISCNSSKKDNSTENKLYSVDELIESPDSLVGKEISVIGTVSHVCSHGGGRCFLIGFEEDANIRVEAGGEITAFEQEQLGDDIIIKGILRETRLGEEYLKEQEEALNNEKESHSDNHHAIGSHGKGVTDISNNEKQNEIDSLKKLIKENGKGYFSIYYIDAISQEKPKDN